MKTLKSWYETTTNGDTVNAVADKSGIVGSTLSRQIKAATLTPENIVAIARAYNADPIEGLLAAGLITEKEVANHEAKVILERLDDRQIANEVWRRLGDGEDHPDFT